MENIYYIIFGDIKAKRNDIIIKDISEGEIFGEIGLFNSIESLYEYYSENECSLIEISYENMFLYIVKIVFKNLFMIYLMMLLKMMNFYLIVLLSK